MSHRSDSPPDLDLLADLVSGSHAGALFARGSYGGKWNLGFPASGDRGFHAVTHGAVQLRTADGEVFSLGAGDIVLVSTAHELASDLSVPAAPYSPQAALLPTPRGGEGDVGLLCGAYRLQEPRNHPVFSNLPPVIVLRAGHRDPSVDGLLTVLEREFQTRAPGGQAIATRLIDAMLVYILRHWIESDCPTAMTWLKALHDPVLARALALIHQRYDQPWTLASLARAAGASRATLIRGFGSEVGKTPIQFLTERRLSAATTLLEQTTLSLDEIATRVGYGSAFSLSKAFKRERGLAPTHYLRQHATQADGSPRARQAP